jgi:hypothetical protein
MILNQVQKLDQEIAPARRVAQQRDHLVSRSSINRAPLWRRAHPRAFTFGSGHWTD